MHSISHDDVAQAAGWPVPFYLLGALTEDARQEYRLGCGHLEEVASMGYDCDDDPLADALQLVRDALEDAEAVARDGHMIRSTRVLLHGELDAEAFAREGFDVSGPEYTLGPVSAYKNVLRDTTGRFSGYVLTVPPYPDGSGGRVVVWSPICLKNELDRLRRRLGEDFATTHTN